MRFSLFTLLLTLFCLPLVAQADASAELLARLKPIEAMSASFHQLTLNNQGQQLQESQGKMEVARGNRFRWHTDTPDEQLVVADGKQVWIYDPGLEQVVIKPLATQLTTTPALLFGGSLAQVQHAFDVSVDGEKGGDARFLLKPKDKQAMFSQLEVSFHEGMPASMRLVDSLGQKTLIDFTRVRLNPTLPAGTFSFTPPADVDVIHQQQ